MREPLPCVREPYAFFVTGSQAAAVVHDLAVEHVALTPHGDDDRTLAEIAESMAERVFDQRLQEQIGDACVAHLRIDVHRHLEPIAESELHDLDIPLQEVELGL